MKDVISGPIFITTLIAVTGVELMRHHWHIDERMGGSSSFSLTNDICSIRESDICLFKISW
jgi:hypothetical protein